LLVDHVALLVSDIDSARAELREAHGLGSADGGYLALAGTHSYMVPLAPPAYLELHAITDRDVARTTESGRRVLACEANGFGFIAWAVLVDNLDEVSGRLGIDVFDYTIPHPDGTLRGWRAVSGPDYLPFFVDYPRNGDRTGRLQAVYDRAAHSCAPTGFSALTVSAPEDELSEWLGRGHDLPLRVVGGRDGVVEATIATSRGDVVVR
jgi:hypothetical protein